MEQTKGLGKRKVQKSRWNTENRNDWQI